MPFSRSFLDFLRKDIGSYSEEERQTLIYMDPSEPSYANRVTKAGMFENRNQNARQSAQQPLINHSQSDRDYFSFNQIDLVFRIENEEDRLAIETDSDRN